MSEPTDYQLTLAKHVLRFLKYTQDQLMFYGISSEENENQLIVHCDADYANDVETGKSINGICIQFYNSLIYWSSKRQNNVSLSTCESEMRSIVESITTLIYVRDLLNELTDERLNCLIFNDNQSAIKTCENGGDFGKNKHYRVKINFVKDVLEQNWLKIKHKEGSNMVADFLTKPLSSERIFKLLQLVKII